MGNKKIILLFFYWFALSVGFAQSESDFKWWNPANSDFTVIDGQGWSVGLKAPYRFRHETICRSL
jgi:hypothetical protein